MTAPREPGDAQGHGLNPAGAAPETIRRGEELYRTLARQLPNVAVIVFDEELRVMVAEGEALMSHGFSETDPIGRALEEVMAPETYAGLESLYRAVLDGKRSERDQQSPDGSRCFRVFGKPMVDDEGAVWAGLALAHDITALRSTERTLRERTEHLANLAQHDNLTGLPNRTVLSDRLGHALARLQRDGGHLAVLFLDLDRFKDVNDSFGHEAGDELLMAVARRLADAARAADTVARLGGDEFVILIDFVSDATDALAAVERIFEALRAPVAVGGTELVLTVSGGVAIAPQDGTTRDTLLAAADRAMYRAKSGGGNQHRFFNPTMHEHALERLQTEAALRHALRRDEFVLHYQPAVDLRTGEVVSVEALIRWNHPERGLLPPGEFIPVAEATGLAADITKWVLTHACRQARDWQSAGLASLRVAVNSCSRELTGGLLGLIRDTLRAADLEPECLEIEVTERFLGEDDAVRDEMLVELKRLGVYITLDDFGTGYSSLARLRDFPVDVIKIDRLFITELDRTAAIAKTIIALAGNLGVAVIAEGVEHEHQLAWLREAGCDAASGFLIRAPQPAEETTAWLLAHVS
ncbi:MAG: EAL domain-containing protein [Solirubrobacteraceae bacterium]